ncbi:hypothetical protein CMUS01_06072 [Colletotrichum musicola]|uniref:Uncharacterized protein n=1 Tax=Colletotrichum musicola TaxID=2175873 RepID=A0A8H6KPE6_9PEZI|nr:hypothetical protein CMUS01_06072 [Colletotrichum musicola]
MAEPREWPLSLTSYLPAAPLTLNTPSISSARHHPSSPHAPEFSAAAEGTAWPGALTSPRLSRKGRATSSPVRRAGLACFDSKPKGAGGMTEHGASLAVQSVDGSTLQAAAALRLDLANDELPTPPGPIAQRSSCSPNAGTAYVADLMPPHFFRRRRHPPAESDAQPPRHSRDLSLAAILSLVSRTFASPRLIREEIETLFRETRSPLRGCIATPRHGQETAPAYS